MRKVKLEILEKLTYRREIIVEVPDEMDENGLEDALSRAERGEEFLSEFMHKLDDLGIECLDGWDDDLSSPHSGEVECETYDFLDEDGDSE